MALTNSQYDAVMREFERRRLAHERDFRKKLADAYLHFPRLQEIDSEIADLSMKKIRITLGQSVENDFDLNSYIDALSSERKALLEAAGFKDGIASPDYDCPVCKDTGVADGKKCSCFKQAEIQLLYAQSRLAGVLEEETFQTFDLSLYPDTVTDSELKFSPRFFAKNAYEYSKSFAENFEACRGNICFIGQNGVGKTFLSHCIAKALIDKGISVLYLTAPELFDIFEENRFKRDKDEDDNSKFIYDCELLIIDDLGANVNNLFVSSQLFRCINERILTKKSTIISTNLSISDLKNEYSDRLTSRIIYSYQRLYLYGDDIRQKKAAQGKNKTLYHVK
jgi:DNA replication protein DnaC